MKDCPDQDVLLTVAEALDWDGEAAMRHILSCKECLTDLRHLERLHNVLDHEVEPTGGFADRVVAALPQPAEWIGQRRDSDSRLLTAAIFVLATITGLALLGVAAIAFQPGGGVGPEVLVFACLVGFAAVRIIPRSAI